MEGEPERSRRVAALLKHPGWNDLMEIAKDRKEREFSMLARSLMIGTEIGEHEIAEKRGYHHGIDWILAVPEREQARLKRNGGNKE